MNHKSFHLNCFIASILILLAVKSIECQQYGYQYRQSNIIRGPIVNSMRSYYQPQNYYSPCGQLSCMNGGVCQNNPYNSQPQCLCRAPYYGNRCEYNPSNNAASQSNNLCRVFNERGMNICQNGGQCVFVSDGKVACVCPSTHKGLFCELPVYLPCNGDPSKTCHRDHGSCNPDGSCKCEEGYAGPRCDKVEACKTGYCLNGAECAELNEEPYRNCSCLPNYYGRRCEIFGIKLNNGTLVRFPRSCNFSISVFNQGGYIARYSVYYNVFDEKQPPIKSGNFPSGATRKVTVPFYAEGVEVVIETIHGKKIVVDNQYQSYNLPCQKCYKIWGPIGGEKWDFIRCK